MPGTCILSIGSFGCNMTCSFCQNYEISQHQPHSKTLPVEQLCQILSEQPNHVGVAFTYNEPFMWYEYVYEAAKKLNKQCHIKNCDGHEWLYKSIAINEVITVH